LLEEKGLFFFEFWAFSLGLGLAGYILGALARTPGRLIVIKHGVWLVSVSYCTVP
jgi:hypothetical protein